MSRLSSNFGSNLGGGREFDLIRGFLAHATRHAHADVRVGAGDDCAIIGPFAISTDMNVEDVHFKRAWLKPEEIGYRAAAAALSDLAAVAAQPVAALISFAFSAADAEGWAQAVMDGATRVIEKYDAILAGGDVTRSAGAATIDVVVIGKVARPVLRSGARAGDDVWVTGSLGGAAAAVTAWQRGEQPDADARVRFAYPMPRLREALWLGERVSLHAMLDLSDGIAGDAGHIAAASGCRIVVDAGKLPTHPAATVTEALQGGEDYELCFTVAAGEVDGVRESFENEFGVSLTRVGSVETGAGVEIRNGPGGSGYDHFATQPGRQSND